jgi:hypothetical protein
MAEDDHQFGVPSLYCRPEPAIASGARTVPLPSLVEAY